MLGWGCNVDKTMKAKIRGTHPYSFRPGEWAQITGVRMVTPDGLHERAVFQVEYDDGFIDGIAIEDSDNYEIKGGSGY